MDITFTLAYWAFLIINALWLGIALYARSLGLLLLAALGIFIGLLSRAAPPDTARYFLLLTTIPSFAAVAGMVVQWWKNEQPAAQVPIVLPTVEEKATPEVAYSALDTAHRNEHTVIVAPSGAGKTQLLQQIILSDIEKDATVIVIDSQSALINNLLHVVPKDRLVHITPSDPDYPLALNLFSTDPSLFEYIFATLETKLTTKQATVYRYLSRLVSVIPGGNLDTMRQLLQKGGVAPYASYLEKLPPIVRDFFTNEYEGPQYRETRDQISQRLYTLLENDAFRPIFTAPENKLDLAGEIYNGKIILIDTSKRTLKDGFSIFGRFFLAQIARSVFDRETPYPFPVYIHIDEFQEYAGEEGFVLELFTQARKFNVGLTVAFQFLDQLHDQVRKAIMANTAVKLCAQNGAQDRRALASEMERDELPQIPKGKFHYHSKNDTFRYFNVEFGRLENLGQRPPSELEAMRQAMRVRYSYVPGRQAVTSEIPKATGEVEEVTKWEP